MTREGERAQPFPRLIITIIYDAKPRVMDGKREEVGVRGDNCNQNLPSSLFIANNFSRFPIKSVFHSLQLQSQWPGAGNGIEIGNVLALSASN